MQAVLGANGPIGEELTRELYRTFTHDIRLVGRNPTKVHDTDQLVTADLTDRDATNRAVEGSEIAYLTVGLPMNAQLWEKQFPAMMRNVIDACATYGTKLVFFDNTYMYPGTTTPQTEATGFEPNGRKGRVRAQIATMLLDAMGAGTVDAVICRAPEFYGPGKTKSLTNSLVFDRIRAGKRPLVPVSAKTVRSLIWTPDASRAMALIGNTPDAYGQTWHLPIDQHRLTYAEMIRTAEQITGRRIRYTVLPPAAFSIGGRFIGQLGETQELLPRYRGDNIFDTAKFTTRFPDFPVTSYHEGITQILR
ncbi:MULTISPECIES: NAD-dependent epimerase/dehydratase family protein [unclassified Streptomyces]|uniref:NAD-dependent epimerase/dehydratase family protein n=1 Tax=unclassified Streptomyces TaxID=2593676 RepID=UPI00192A00BB|nr:MULTISPECIES: NAD-dependent epimerase/dehydratase family protein [unclassified Streptomyces]CAD5919695.1 Nucleoside-diphosphate-sugar epimerase [Streptomyces sp. KY70]CAD5991531.1 Nucleoside-diphosphate-sugar epimerase [Streptomyces sp. KY75]